MDKALKPRGRRVLCVIAALVMMLAAAAPLVAYAADNPLRFAVKQVFTASSALADGTFTYRLKALEPDNPMPAGSAAEGYTFAITGNNGVETGPLAYNKQGIYQYELVQVIGTEKPGYTYDRRVYTLEVYVDAALKAELVVRNQDGTKAGEIKFENAYHALPSDPSLMADPPVKKTVSGNPGSAGTFMFKLAAGDISYPMPAGSTNGTKTIQIVGSGEGMFGNWSYREEGVYYYSVYEVNAGENGYTYDTAVYTVTDTVKAENGQLVVARIVTNSMNKPVAEFAFINVYRGGPVNPDDPDPGKPGPITGDDRNTALYAALLALGVILIIGAAGYLSRGRRRHERT